jgi:hypothetical protein
MLQCPRCGWIRGADTFQRGSGFYCRNCKAHVQAVDLDGRNLYGPGVKRDVEPGP